MFNAYRVSVEEDKKILEVDGSKGDTRLNIFHTINRTVVEMVNFTATILT